MTDTNPDALARLEALHAAATDAAPGPLSVRGDNADVYCERGKVADCGTQWANDDDDEGLERDAQRGESFAASIVALHNAFPAMAKVVRAAREYERVSKIRDEFPPPPAAGVEWSYLRAREALDAALAEFEKEVGRG